MHHVCSQPEAKEAGSKIGKSLSELGATLLFEKVLTTSDANGQGRIVVPKASRLSQTLFLSLLE